MHGEIAMKLLLAMRDVGVNRIGIEKGTAKNAVESYLKEKAMELKFPLDAWR